MKKIVNEKLYNTETAHRVGTYRFDFDDGVQHICTTLYRDRDGEYFLYNRSAGVPVTNVAEEFGGQIIRESIIPMTPDAAKKWTERYLNEDEYINEFGKPQGYYKRNNLPQFSEIEMNFITLVVLMAKSFPYFSVDDIPGLVKDAFRNRSNGFAQYIDVERTIKKVCKMNHWQLVEFFKRINTFVDSLSAKENSQA
ncbi:hypothetical protein [Succiniclasticum ruminis]|uniref:Uncharacterized protein n=1 Tax=Succiniclasticum ruminis DSM 9236 TaxID=1123323 RepID=A0A1I2D4U1_9FIRM|nr:hypothetical protein [Succiniclasticum ruminis]SFE75536.1 hypothetical protein SAMN05216245_1175 [Succiniclasticum ruminis DSM 9236]